MTFNSVMAIILRYFAEFRSCTVLSLRAQLNATGTVVMEQYIKNLTKW